jgi:hypothetical protein
MVVDRPLKRSGAPPAVNPDAIFSSPPVIVGGVRKRETGTELKELVFEETHGTKRERESFFLMGFDELDSFFMIITERRRVEDLKRGGLPTSNYRSDFGVRNVSVCRIGATMYAAETYLPLDSLVI